MRPPSLAWRALIALLLMVGFYGLALAMIGILLFIPYAEWTYLHRIDLRILLFCISGALIIAISIFPRPDRFVAPGPRLTALKQPRLFAEVGQIARAVRQAMPAEVYLAPDVNAWVAQRGGIMGFGSRRVMAVGLPLLQILNVSELRAVLAHEFGHYYGGDTRLGPWVYKTRQAIIRTVQSLQRTSELLQMLFVGYAKLFLRVTHAVSRQQEFSADALAARTVGKQASVSGLQKVHSIGRAFEPFWVHEVVPVLNFGFRPPLVEGFDQFIHSHSVAQAIAQVLENEKQRSETNPYDTHPAMRDRIAALETLRTRDRPLNDRPAISLVEDVPELEKQMIEILGGKQMIGALTPVAWTQVANRVYLPMYENTLREYSQALEGITPGNLGDLAKNPYRLRAYVDSESIRAAGRVAIEQFARHIIGAALTVVLKQRGWEIETAPGNPLQLHHGSLTIEPFNILARLASGELSLETWHQQCERAGILDIHLGSVTSAGA